MDEKTTQQMADEAVNQEARAKPEEFDSTDDRRTENTNTMRQKYRELSPKEKEHMSAIKGLSDDLWQYLDDLGQSRELSLAKTKIEEACMWGVRHVTA